MKTRLILTAIGLTVLAAGMFAGPAPAGAAPLTIFLQADTRPMVEKLFFDDGFQYLLKELPAEKQIVLVGFEKNDYRTVYAGGAGALQWPRADFSFSLANPATTPYKNLLAYLTKAGAHDQTVLFVSNGTSQDMFQLMDTEGMIRGAQTFIPNKYFPLDQLKDYCKKNRVRLVGLYERDISTRGIDFNDISFNAFRYVVEESGGKCYYNFITFKGIFTSLLKSGLLG